MITLAGYLLAVFFVFLFVWFVLPAHNTVQERREVAQAPVVEYRLPEPVAYNYAIETAQDSVRLLKRFGRIQRKANERTRRIRQLQAESDSLFCEVVNGQVAGQ